MIFEAEAAGITVGHHSSVSSPSFYVYLCVDVQYSPLLSLDSIYFVSLKPVPSFYHTNPQICTYLGLDLSERVLLYTTLRF